MTGRSHESLECLRRIGCIRHLRALAKRLLGLTAPVALLALGTICTEASAQTHYSSNVCLGVKGGADMSRVMFSPSVRQGWKPGATAGFMFRYIEENHFGLIAELNFIQRGWKEDFETAPLSYSRTLDYLELPILAHVYFGNRGKFFFNAGPQVGVLLGERTSANFNPAAYSEIPGFPVKNRQNSQLDMPVSNRLDYGISAGLGGEFNLNPRNSLELEARFYFGLGNIMSARRADVFSASNSMTLSLALGYWFRIK